METIYKVLENCEVKKVGERQYEFTASTADMDRDGEVINVEGWDLKNFKKNPVIMFGHDYRSLPIGRATKIGVRDGKLMNTVEFPPEGTYEFADTVARLVDAGYLKTESVGFVPKKWEDGDFDDEKGNKPRRTYTKQELLEISIVPVPSNPNALMNAVKEGVITQKQFKSITEPEVEDKTVSYNDELKRSQLNDAFFAMVDTLISCYFKTVRDKQDENKPKTMKSHAKSFNASFIQWIDEAGEAGLFNQSQSNDLDMIFFSFNDYLSKLSKQVHNEKSPRIASQESIIDEIDYLKSLIEKEGMNDITLKAIGGLVKSTWGELLKMDMGKMQEMHDMMASAETMAKKSKKMAEDMMSEYEDDEEDMKRISGSDIPAKDKITFNEIKESLKRIMEVKSC